MEYTDIQASVREKTGKGIARQLRFNGKLPAVLYGGPEGALSLTMDYKAVEKLLRSHSGGHSVINLKIDGAADQYAMLKDVQNMTMRNVPMHVDLVRISMDKKVEVSIPIELINTEVIKRSGGIIQQTLSEVTILCLPDRIPDSIKVDLAACKVGDAITVADLPQLEDISIVDEADEVIASVLTPKAADEKAAEPAAAPVAEKKEKEKAKSKDDRVTRK